MTFTIFALPIVKPHCSFHSVV